MKPVIEKALKKAQSKGLGLSSTADLILEYLEVAGDIGDLVLIGTDSPNPPPLPTPKSDLLSPAENNSSISAGSAVNRVLKQPTAGDANPWTTSDLLTALSKVELSFKIQPEGWLKEQNYVGSLYAIEGDGQGLQMSGVRVVFRNQDREADRQDWPIFFPCSQANIDANGAVQGLRDSLNQVLRLRKDPIVSSTVPRTSFPSLTPSAPSLDGNSTGSMF